MIDIDAVDFFQSGRVLASPYEYLATMRGEGPVRQEKYHDVYMITGYEEAVQVYNDRSGSRQPTR